MHAEIIAIGTELTTGAKLDTNSQWLSVELQAVGIPVHFHVTVADDLAAMSAVRLTVVEQAQAEIAKTAVTLAEQEKVTIVNPTDKMV